MGDTILLRCLAGLLIANSHIERYYPIRQLAADGLLGNALFLVLSGYGLARSELRSHRPFLEWYGRRASRIYPSLFLVVLACDLLLNGHWRDWKPADYAWYFGLAGGPGGPYYFVCLIFIFYALYYGFLKAGRARLFRNALLALFLPYAAVPLLGRGDLVFHALHWTFHFQMMLLGGWLAFRNVAIAPGGRRALAGFLGLLVVYVGLRLVVSTGRFDRWFFLPHLVVFPMVFLLLRLARSEWSARLLTNRWIGRGAALMAGATLELYLVHYHVMPIRFIAGLVFPLNVVTFLAVSIALAVLCARAADLLRGLTGPKRAATVARESPNPREVALVPER